MSQFRASLTVGIVLIAWSAVVIAQYNIEDDDPEAPQLFRQATAGGRGSQSAEFNPSSHLGAGEARTAGSRHVHERDYAPSYYNQATRNYYGPTDGLAGYSGLTGAPSHSSAASSEFSGPTSGTDDDGDDGDVDERPRDSHFDDMPSLGRAASSAAGIGEGSDDDSDADEGSSPYPFSNSDSNGRLNRAASHYGRSFDSTNAGVAGQSRFFGGDYTGLTDMWANARPSASSAGYRVAGSGRRPKSSDWLDASTGFGMSSSPASQSAPLSRRPSSSSEEVDSDTRDSSPDADDD
ncbi:hypothetical protein GZH46_00671 [Fragariocoptes setiger]|uniref:Uncharacterized protein n=1 Tax=Fragariocoptes setiger TaxID=1670756 RepID=A0ABQ7SBL4_9ACAR|nr:hypothetical protein GZH46_00671 [Fragariocoptes setiger]